LGVEHDQVQLYSSGSPARPYRADIDGLRAIAVTAVVLFHAFPDLLPGGFLGVDVFFVISGYLITGIIQDAIAAGTFRVTAFYARRIRRIVPALLLVLTASFVAGGSCCCRSSIDGSART
jgi:peptidoglycan/LPS O-acetylase OafA/YrhL